MQTWTTLMEWIWIQSVMEHFFGLGVSWDWARHWEGFGALRWSWYGPCPGQSAPAPWQHGSPHDEGSSKKCPSIEASYAQWSGESISSCRHGVSPINHLLPAVRSRPPSVSLEGAFAIAQNVIFCHRIWWGMSLPTGLTSIQQRCQCWFCVFRCWHSLLWLQTLWQPVRRRDWFQ